MTSRKKTMVARYVGGELSATFTQTFEWDNGGREYPSGWVPCHDVECISLSILGADVNYSDMPDDVQEAVSALSDECEWEDE